MDRCEDLPVKIDLKDAETNMVVACSRRRDLKQQLLCHFCDMKFGVRVRVRVRVDCMTDPSCDKAIVIVKISFSLPLIAGRSI